MISDEEHDYFKHQIRMKHQHDKINKHVLMANGEIDPTDKNYFKMVQGREVIVDCKGELVKGKIRTLKEAELAPDGIPCYIVEKEDGEVLTTLEFHKRPHRPPHTIGYAEGVPMLFKINRPNHKYIFDDEVSYEDDFIEAIKKYARGHNQTVFDLMSKIEYMSEKYPEKFI